MCGRKVRPVDTHAIVEICFFFFPCGMKIHAHGAMVPEDTCHKGEAEVREE